MQTEGQNQIQIKFEMNLYSLDFLWECGNSFRLEENPRSGKPWSEKEGAAAQSLLPPVTSK
jgi:hypothetical protein